MNIQDKITMLLKATSIPYKKIECYGAQIMVTSWSEDAAKRWAAFISEFATIRRGCYQSIDYKGKGPIPTNGNKETITVWRTAAFMGDKVPATLGNGEAVRLI